MICGEINYFLYFLLSHVTSNNGFGLQSNCEELWSRTILTDQLPPLTPITVKLITSSHQLSRISPPYQRWWKRKAVIDNGNESVLNGQNYLSRKYDHNLGSLQIPSICSDTASLLHCLCISDVCSHLAGVVEGSRLPSSRPSPVLQQETLIRDPIPDTARPPLTCPRPRHGAFWLSAGVLRTDSVL